MEWVIEKRLGAFVESRFSIPFKVQQVVYYAHKDKPWKKRPKWVVSICVVTGVWATNTYGVFLDSGEQIPYGHFDVLFADKEEAIEYCIKKNAHSKVKVYGG